MQKISWCRQSFPTFWRALSVQFLQHPDEEDEGRGLERVVNGRKPPGPGVFEHPDQPLPEGLLLDPERPRGPFPPDRKLADLGRGDHTREEGLPRYQG